MAKSQLDNYIDKAGEVFGKLPPLSVKAKEAIVAITPWIALVFGVLGVIGSLGALGVFAVFSPFAALGGYNAVGYGIIYSVLAIVSSVLLLAAFPGTKARKAMGWKLLLLSEVVSVVSNVISFSIFGVVLSLVALYFLFQIRAMYK